MLQSVEYRFVFNRKNKLNKNGQALIQLETYLNGKRKYFSTGIYITPDQWDKKKHIIKNHPQSQQLNWQLGVMKQQYQEFEMEMKRKHGKFDLSMFELLKNKASVNFWEMFENYYQTQNVSKSRKTYIKRTIKYLKEFAPFLSFENFDLQTIYGFEYFLQSKGLHTNTIMQHHKVVKHFLNIMVRNDVIKDNPYNKFKIKKAKTERVFLTEDELKALEGLELPERNRRMQEVLDMFRFSCYTGLRFSDIQALTPKNVEKYDNGEVVLRIRQQKTGDFVAIPLHLVFKGKAIDILNKYYDKNKERIFPKSSNQDVNRQLKLIQVLADLNKTLTFHVARHTFGTLLAKFTHDPYLIKQLMGHSDIQTSMTYIHLSNEMVNERLKNIDWN